MPFEIIRDDITHVKADAIVNTANPHPIVGAGTDSAIHRAAGPRLLEARKEIGEIPVGKAVETPAFDLSARYVLHTVSPAWANGSYGEETLLREAYDSALDLADRLRCRSVAFPLLSAGSYGFPKDVALSVAIRAFTDFLLSHDMRIILVVFERNACSLASGLFGGLKTYIDDRYVAGAKKDEYAGSFDVRIRRRTAFAETMIAQQSREGRHAKAAFSVPNAPRAEAEEICEGAAIAPKAVMQEQDLEKILKDAESTFSEYLIDLLNECGEKDSDVYRRAEISRQLFHKIISRKDYQPTKSTAIQLALGLRLDLAETQKLLEKAGYALTRSSKTDLVVQYFIEHGVYSIVEINMALFDCGLPLLRTGSVS